MCLAAPIKTTRSGKKKEKQLMNLIDFEERARRGLDLSIGSSALDEKVKQRRSEGRCWLFGVKGLTIHDRVWSDIYSVVPFLKTMLYSLYSLYSIYYVFSILYSLYSLYYIFIFILYLYLLFIVYSFIVNRNFFFYVEVTGTSVHTKKCSPRLVAST